MGKKTKRKYNTKEEAIKILGVSRAFFEDLWITPDETKPNPKHYRRDIQLYLKTKIRELKSDPRVLEYHQKKQEKLMSNY